MDSISAEALTTVLMAVLIAVLMAADASGMRPYSAAYTVAAKLPLGVSLGV